jgi:heme/copper-type cytochrome/quinol oxidase subunit 2
MNLEAWGIVLGVIIALAGWGVERMPKPNSWAPSIVLWCLAAGVLVSTLIYWLFQYFYAWFASTVLWCLAGIMLLATLIYWLYRRRKPQQARRTPTKKAKKTELTPWLRCLIFAFWTLIIIVFITFGFIGQVGILTPPTPNTEWLWGHPSPQEIWQDIDKYSPYNQETVRHSYEGLSVTWGITLFDATDTPDGLGIWAYPSGADSPAISFTVDANYYPEIKSMQRGTQFVVQGTIAKVDTIYIELDNCRLILD